MKNTHFYWMLPLLFLSSVSMGNSLPTSGVTSWTKKVGGRERVAKIYSPLSQTSKKLPILFFLHGGTGNMDRTRKQIGAGLEEQARSYGFIVVYPQGTSSAKNNKNHWNDGRDSNFGDNDVSAVDDVGFLNFVVKDLLSQYSGLDKNKVFLAGVSNGGMMTMRMACESPGKFAGFAPLISSFPQSMQGRCQKQIGKPMMFLNGTKDRLVSFDGKDRRPIFLKGKLKTSNNRTVPQTLRFFAEKNGCKTSEPQANPIPDIDKSDHTSVVKYDYECPKGAPLRFYKVVGGGHNIPGSQIPNKKLLKRIIGESNRDVDTPKLLIEFFFDDRS